MGDKKYIHLVFMVLAVVASWVAINLVELVWSYFARPAKLWPELMGIGIGVIAVGFYWLKQDAFDWVGSIVHELKRVSWPNKQETYSATVVVIVTVIIFSILLFFFDAIWAFTTDKILLN